MIKRLSLYLPLAVPLLVVLFVLWTIPFYTIEQLKTGYVDVQFLQNKVSYTYSKKKPANWSNYSAISPHATHAILISEDWGFYEHHGIDWAQLMDAFQDYFYHDDELRGASTITQQLVKNLFLDAERSYWRKLKEAMISLYLETRLSKKRILELYLNVIEYGEGVYGIRSASKHYFSKAPLTLTAREGAFLAMLLPSPEKYAISYRQKNLTPYADMMINSILSKMKMAKFLSEEEMQEAGEQRFSWENMSSSLLLSY